jgi:hypothetical protein
MRWHYFKTHEVSQKHEKRLSDAISNVFPVALQGN